MPDEKSWGQNYQVIEDMPEFYTVANWAADSVDAASGNTSSDCRTTTMNLNFKTKEFFLVTRNAGGSCDALGVSLPKLTQPRISQIIDGKKVIETEFSRVEKAAFDALSNDFKTKIQSLMGKSPQK